MTLNAMIKKSILDGDGDGKIMMLIDQARDLPDVDSSWWQSSKDVSDPFAKVTSTAWDKISLRTFPSIGSVDASGGEDCGDPVCVKFALPGLGRRVSPSPLPQCCHHQDLYP